MRNRRTFGRLVRILILVGLAGFWMGQPRPPGLPGCRGPRPPRPPMPFHEPADPGPTQRAPSGP
jgi:hypothetical protein